MKRSSKSQSSNRSSKSHSVKQFDSRLNIGAIPKDTMTSNFFTARTQLKSATTEENSTTMNFFPKTQRTKMVSDHKPGTAAVNARKANNLFSQQSERPIHKQKLQSESPLDHPDSAYGLGTPGPDIFARKGSDVKQRLKSLVQKAITIIKDQRSHGDSSLDINPVQLSNDSNKLDSPDQISIEKPQTQRQKPTRPSIPPINIISEHTQGSQVRLTEQTERTPVSMTSPTSDIPQQISDRVHGPRFKRLVVTQGSARSKPMVRLQSPQQNTSVALQVMKDTKSLLTKGRDMNNPEHVEQMQERFKLYSDLFRDDANEMPEDMIRIDQKEVEHMNLKSDSTFRRLLNQQQEEESLQIPQSSPAGGSRNRLSIKHMHPSMSPYMRLTSIEQVKQQLDRTDRKEFLQKFQIAKQHLDGMAKNEYYTCFKQHDKFEQFQQLYKQRDNVYMALVKSNSSQNALPKMLDLVQENSTLQEVVSPGNCNNPKYPFIFSNSLRNEQNQNIKSLSFHKNSMRTKGLNIMLDNLPENLEILDLSNNLIESFGLKALIKTIDSSLRSLHVLNLEANKFGDRGCQIICEYVAESRTINALNLSKNGLSVFSCESISKMIRKTSQLAELYLHYNSINDSGGSLIFKTLLRNQSLKVLDLSFNNLGRQKPKKRGPQPQGKPQPSECAQSIFKVISKSQVELLHLDLSYNGFSELDSREIARGLAMNQTIYGFHFEGNFQPFVVNPIGFLTNHNEDEENAQNRVKNAPENLKTLFKAGSSQKIKLDNLDSTNTNNVDKKINQFENHRDHDPSIAANLVVRRIDSTNPTFSLPKNRDNTKFDVCWICEGWQEIKFAWQMGKSGQIQTEPVFVHLSFENFKPILLTNINDEHILYKMCPPNIQILYFFSNPMAGIFTVATNQNYKELPEHHFLKTMPQKYYYNNEAEVDMPPIKVTNYLLTSYEKPVVDASKHYVPSFYCKPRDEFRKFTFTNQAKEVSSAFVMWTIENSIFNNFYPDSDAVYDECFEFDLQHSKVQSLVKPTDFDQIKAMLQELYRSLMPAYKYYTSTSYGQPVPCISGNIFNDLLSNTQIIDSKRLQYKDLYLIISAANGKDVRYPLTVDKCLVRFQFMEIFLRIAIEKYVRPGVIQSPILALKRILEEDQLSAFLQDFDSNQHWRDERFWTQKCDNLLKQKQPFLRLLFKYMVKLSHKQKTNKSPWANPQDFRALFAEVGLINDNLTDRDIFLAFLLAMRTQVNEISLQRHIQMHYYEFIEGLARVAEKVSLIPMTEFKKEVPKLSLEERRIQPLEIKLEGLIVWIYYRLAEKMKKVLDSNDEDMHEIDNSVLGAKRAKLRLQLVATVVVTGGRRKKKLISQTVQIKTPVVQIGSDEDDGANSDSDQEKDYYDPIKQEADFEEQIKVVVPQSELEVQVPQLKPGQKVKVGELHKPKPDKLKEHFTLVTTCKYIKRVEEKVFMDQLNRHK